jgi:hypothetical protein
MAINPQQFNLRQFAQPGVSNRPMFQQAAPVNTQTAAQPIVPPQVDPSRGGIIGPLEKYLAENSIDSSVISGGAGVETLAGGEGTARFGGRPVITGAPPPEILQKEAPVEEAPVPGPMGIRPGEVPETVQENINSVRRAATDAAQVAVESGKVSEPEAITQVAEGEQRVEALTSDPDLDTFEGQLEAVLGAKGKQYTQDDYNEKAKSILGLDQGEEDVPVWAAPLFLFGLELLKGEGPGDLLGDIGAAGTKAFPVLGAELARRRKDRKDVGLLAHQLQTADVATRTAALDRLWKRQQWLYVVNLQHLQILLQLGLILIKKRLLP